VIVDIFGIIDHHCFSFVFIICKENVLIHGKI